MHTKTCEVLLHTHIKMTDYKLSPFSLSRNHIGLKTILFKWKPHQTHLNSFHSNHMTFNCQLFPFDPENFLNWTKLPLEVMGLFKANFLLNCLFCPGEFWFHKKGIQIQTNESIEFSSHDLVALTHKRVKTNRIYSNREEVPSVRKWQPHSTQLNKFSFCFSQFPFWNSTHKNISSNCEASLLFYTKFPLT